MDRYWSTPRGLHAAQNYRRMVSLRISADMIPPSKRAMGAVKARAREVLGDAFASSRAHASLYPKVRWPKPRAAVALDIALYGELLNAPRVDTICKWLLDELAGLVYRDDRQVKLLFAHADRRDREAELANSRTDPRREDPSASATFGAAWSVISDEPGLRGLDAKPKSSPTLYVHARTRANVLAALRATGYLPYSWDPIDDDDDYKYWNPYTATYPGSRRSLVEYRELLESRIEPDADELTLVGRQLDYHDQASEQRIVDVLFSSLFTFLPAQRFLGWNLLRDRLGTAPYVFDLGVLPDIGGSAAFRSRLQVLLNQRRTQYPELFPMRAKSGISMVLFEDGTHEKDLDNLVRTVLPDVLDVLRPPRTDRPGWVATAPDIESTYPDIPFLEVAALSAKDADMPPGTLIFGLSGGHRRQSWWAKAESDLERQLDQLIDRH
ncbi:MAG TPA: hypothetical protein VN041_12085 [Microbacterium sp.]|nr:hypothetical protein [Microbacterium sp.]